MTSIKIREKILKAYCVNDSRNEIQIKKIVQISQLKHLYTH